MEAVNEELTVVDPQLQEPDDQQQQQQQQQPESRPLFAPGANIVWILLAWQVLSVVFAGASLCSEGLTSNEFVFPAIQSFCNYVWLFLMWAPISLHMYLNKKNTPAPGAGAPLVRDNDDAAVAAGVPWYRTKTALFTMISFMDFFSIYCMVYAFQYTSVVSISALDALSLPVAMALSMVFLSVAYKLHQFFAVFVCVCGVVLFTIADYLYADADGSYDYLLGDALVLIGASLQAGCSVAADFYCHTRKQEEGSQYSQLRIIQEMSFWIAIWGLLLSGLTAWATGEITIMVSLGYNTSWTWYLLGFGFLRALFISLVPLLLLYSGATIMMLSMQTSDFWTFLGGVLLFSFSYHSLYLIAMLVITLGIAMFCLEDMNCGRLWKRAERRFRHLFERSPEAAELDDRDVDGLRVYTVEQSTIDAA
eukprot:TRINITY_DN45772_c0_g1_i1.p1 TRINITY_DN45772_c0_g1~~TRINITY_DN45772_c0_g1_i1.p1  ORF type:complete len:433 (-),score=90.54 TRINITY_DN45772_c0_g1_i1:148-1410(-)